MTKVITKNYSDTPISGVTTLTFPRGLMNFKTDFRVKSNGIKEMVMTNLTSPIAKPESVRIAVTDVANVYSGTDLEPSVFAPSKKGMSILVQLTNVLTVTDSANPDYIADLPISAHLVLKVPNNENLTASMLQENLGRLLSCLFDTGSTESSRLEAILRGSLVPSEV